MEGVVAGWQDRPVLVTGHRGFKGSWLSAWLAHKGSHVVGYGVPDGGSSTLFEQAEAPWADEVEGDVRDLDLLTATVRRHRPDAIFHLAAQPLVRMSYADPVATFETNVMGSVNLLEAVRATDGPCAVVVVTSDKCYENDESGRPFKERDPLGGRDPYSSSKAAAELVCSAYRSSFFTPEWSEENGVALATARAGNVVGGGDWQEDRLLPDIIRALRADDVLTLRYPHAVRPWQHVLDVTKGYLRLMECLLRGSALAADAWNFGPPRADEPRTVQDVVNTTVEAWGSGLSLKTVDGSLPEAKQLWPDSEKARHRLGWRTRLSFEDTILWTVDWYRRRIAGESGWALAREQIRYFEQANEDA